MTQTSTDQRHWYAVQAIPQREATAVTNLTRLGVNTFLPLIRSSRTRLVNKWDGSEFRKVRQFYPRTESLFPGYLFAEFILEEMWGRLRYEHGLRVVRLGEQPAPVEEEFIGELASAVDDEGFFRLKKRAALHYDTLRPGVTVEITGGVWSGLTGKFVEGMRGGDRVLVLLGILGGGRPVEFDRRDVHPWSGN